MDLAFIRQWTSPDMPYLTGRLDNNRLSTALQPVYSLAHKRIVGHEALVRVSDSHNTPLSPAAFFQKKRSDAQIIHLDRLCRYIHLHNYKILGDPLNWLFLNVSPQTISSGAAYGSFLKELLDAMNFPPHRIVIEVVEHPIEDSGLILETITYYKALGCLIAIDDFGAGHSNFDRIWAIRPDIVKLDRSFLVQASASPGIRSLLPGIVNLLHQAGSLVLMEGVETQDQAMMAMESDVDFVQGYYFGKPFTELHLPQNAFNRFSQLMVQHKILTDQTETGFQKSILRYRTLFTLAADKLKQGSTMDNACHDLLQESQVVRCYLIGTDGVQVGQTLVSDTCTLGQDQRFKPLEDSRSADWFRRHYLKRAMFHPEQLQVTRPYLSIAGAHMCITLSMKFDAAFGGAVLCCDLKA